jgi:hypothetical protein
MDLDPNVVSANFTRPSDTNAYAAGDLVANNTSAGSVVAMSWVVSPAYPRASGYSPVYISGVRLHASKATVTAASFRVHLYSASPTFTSSGDNGVFGTVVATGNANWLASFDVTMVALHADGASGIAVPTEGVVVPQVPSGGTVYGLIEALAAYTPSSAEVFTAELLLETVRP